MTIVIHIGKKSLGVTSKNCFKISEIPETLLHPPTAQQSLEQAFDLNNVNWSKIHLLARVTTTEPSLRSFQYIHVILHNTLYLNQCLFKFDIVDSPLCSFCKQENEALKLAVYGNYIYVSTWTSSKNITQPSEWTPQVLILGVWDKKMQDLTLVNHLFLIFKCYIYLKRNEVSNFNGLKAYIKST